MDDLFWSKVLYSALTVVLTVLVATFIAAMAISLYRGDFGTAAECACCCEGGQ